MNDEKEKPNNLPDEPEENSTGDATVVPESNGDGALDVSEDKFNRAEGMTEDFDADDVLEAKTDGAAYNLYLRRILDDNFLEYASYVITDRAIPNVDDGMKPVQRRILWTLHKMDDGKMHKAANAIGQAMHYHPHGDASIGDALVNMANKGYFIKRQGNFGNIFTGHRAAASRYIECSLSDLAREVLFNSDITKFVDSYDGRNKEPITLPAKVPALLMQGTYGIAVGMRTNIMPHNFNELLNAQIAILRGEDYELYPDFLQGGLMDVREYEDGNGKITLRAKIDVDGKRLIIREIPASTTTESLIASIEKAEERNKIKVQAIHDYTSDKVEIEILLGRGYDAEKALRALYMYTDCSQSIAVNMMVICDGKPREMSVHEVLARNTEHLLDFLQRELEIELAKLEEEFHYKTLAQIFIENRIYKRIEECESEEAVLAEVHSGLAPFRHLVRRDITDADVEKLLSLQIRRISKFDIEKNQKELKDILNAIDKVHENLKSLKDYTIKYLQGLLKKYGSFYPRRTEIEQFGKIDRAAAALNNIRIGYDRKTGYIGTAIKSEEPIICNEFDRLLMVEKNGKFKITDLPGDKLFIGRMYECRRFDARTEFGIIYREKKSGKIYGKRSRVGGYIKDKEYNFCPTNCQLELFTPRADAIYNLFHRSARTSKSEELNLLSLPIRSPKARGVLLSSAAQTTFKWQRFLTEEELLALQSNASDEVADEILENGGEASLENDGATADLTTLDEEEIAVVEPEMEQAVASKTTPEPEKEKAPRKARAKKEAPVVEPEIVSTASNPIVDEPVSNLVADEPLAPSEKVRKPRKKATAIKPETEQNTKPETKPETPSSPEEKKTPEDDKPLKATKSEKPQKDDDDDEFGIVQPEFGF